MLASFFLACRASHELVRLQLEESTRCNHLGPCVWSKKQAQVREAFPVDGVIRLREHMPAEGRVVRALYRALLRGGRQVLMLMLQLDAAAAAARCWIRDSWPCAYGSG